MSFQSVTKRVVFEKAMAHTAASLIIFFISSPNCNESHVS